MGIFLRSMAFSWLSIQFLLLNWAGYRFISGPQFPESLLYGGILLLVGNLLVVSNFFLLTEKGKEKLEAYLSRKVSDFSVKALTVFNSFWFLWIGFLAFSASGPFF